MNIEWWGKMYIVEQTTEYNIVIILVFVGNAIDPRCNGLRIVQKGR